MKGLLLKDFYSMGANRRGLLLLLAMVTSLSYFMNGPTFAPTMLGIYLMVTSTSLFSLDENARWDRYARSAPLTSRILVVGRYLFILLSLVGILLLGFAIGGTAALLRGEQGWLLPLLNTSGAMGLVVLVSFAFMAPVLYRLGAEKGRIAAMIIFLVPYMLVLYGMRWLEPFFKTITLLPTLVLAGGALLLGLLIYIVSMVISTRICARREL